MQLQIIIQNKFKRTVFLSKMVKYARTKRRFFFFKTWNWHNSSYRKSMILNYITPSSQKLSYISLHNSQIPLILAICLLTLSWLPFKTNANLYFIWQGHLCLIELLFQCSLNHWKKLSIVSPHPNAEQVNQD